MFGTNDEYVSEENRQAVIDAGKPTDEIDIFDGYPHSAWTFQQAEDIICCSVAFLAKHLGS